MSVTAGFSNSSSPAVAVGVGLDSTSTMATDCVSSLQQALSSNLTATAIYAGLPGLGYHYLAWLEWSAASGTTTWRGAPSGVPSVLGMTGRTFA